MMRIWNWNAIGLKTLLAAALAASPSHAQTSNPAADSERFGAIQKQLDGLKQQLEEVQKLLSGVTKVGKNIEDVRAEMIASLQEAQRQIKDQIDQLKADVNALRSRDTSAARVSAFAPSDSQVTGGTGRVQITNSYSSPIAVRVNQIVYHVPPNQIVTTADIPSGRFTYEVLGVTEPRERSLSATKVFPIHVHPQW
jgi:septal ring factor EnvC (AmiA/AmiB activator)